MKISLLVLSFCAALIGVPTIAEAGNCPSCETADDCPGGFCVLHDGEVGCGATVQMCCPGQACAIAENGRPSCEGAGTCSVIAESVQDAGVGADGSNGDTDAGLGVDGGISADAATGQTGDSDDDSDCSCSAASPGTIAPLLTVLFALTRKRRRQNVAA